MCQDFLSLSPTTLFHSWDRSSHPEKNDSSKFDYSTYSSEFIANISFCPSTVDLIIAFFNDCPFSIKCESMFSWCFSDWAIVGRDIFVDLVNNGGEADTFLDVKGWTMSSSSLKVLWNDFSKWDLKDFFVVPGLHQN